MAFSIFFLSFRLLQWPQFLLKANIPLATLAQGKGDICNILTILFIFTLANATAAYVVYAQAIP